MKCRYQDAHTDGLNTWERQNLRKHYKTLTFRGHGTRFHYRWIMLKENVCIKISNFTLELNSWQCQHYTKNMIATLKNVNASINEGHSSYSMVHQIQTNIFLSFASSWSNAWTCNLREAWKKAKSLCYHLINNNFY